MGVGNGLRNKRVVVLGGSSGIGFAVAELAASEGAKVVIASSNPERVQKAIESVGGEVEGHAVDVSDERALEAFFAKLSRFDHLVYTAGDSLDLHDLARSSRRLGGPLNCAIGLRSRRSNTEAQVFTRGDLSY
jgi:NAD(P)-dependent dehydrogenase (short-subunit alcohol dehydrogenase family)